MQANNAVGADIVAGSSFAIHDPRSERVDVDGQSTTICFHCLEPVPQHCDLVVELDGRIEPMCCIGCKAAAEFIFERGLTRFYEHRARLEQKDFFAEVATHSAVLRSKVIDDSKWQFLDAPETALDYVLTSDDGRRHFTLNIDGLYCNSCTWLIDRALKTLSRHIEFQANIDARSGRISISDAALPLSTVVTTIESLGYLPSLQAIGDTSTLKEITKKQKNSAVQRIVVAGFGMMQVMTYATAGYFGGSAEVGSTGQAMPADMERFFLVVSMLVSTVVVFYSGKPFFTNAINDLRNRHLGMDVPVALAIASAYFPSVYQVLTHANSHVYFDSAVMFVFFLSLGRYVEMRARHRLGGASTDLYRLLPKTINIQRQQGGELLSLNIKPSRTVLGDQLPLRVGDTVPFDAMVKEGVGQLDESLVTGEPNGVNKQPGQRLIAGSCLLSGELLIESLGDWPSSSIAKIQESLQAAQRSGQREQNQNRLVGRFFILAILMLTAVVGIAWMFIQAERVFEICLAMLIASCPCAFSLASPVGRSAAIHYLRGIGVLLTNNKALSTLPNVSTWCFDKTGTLTQGSPSISKVDCLSSVSDIACLRIVATLERHSKHSLSSAFDVIQTPFSASNVTEVIGCGVQATIEGTRYRAGKRSWVLESVAHDEGLLQHFSETGTEIVLANSDGLLAIIQLCDALRPSSTDFVSYLTQNRKNVLMLTGDNEKSATGVARALNIKELRSGLLPDEKVDVIREQQGRNEIVAMVGDGINDAPVLASADISIAMASGSNLALNNADIVLLNGNLNNLGFLIDTSVRLATITRQNLAWALGYNLIALPLAATGYLTPWIAALGMSLSSLFVVFNALRVRVPEWK